VSSRFILARDDKGRLIATPNASYLEYESHLECTDIPVALRAALEDEPHEWIGGLNWGPTGAGKSYGAIQELNTPLRTGSPAKFISIPRYIGELRDTAMLEPHEEHVRLLRSAAVTRYAVLDDLGAEKLTEFANEQLYLLIDGRAAKGLPTLVTSNLSIQEIAAVHGDRIASRILGFSAVPPRKLEGRDRRVPSRAATNSAFLRFPKRARGEDGSKGISQSEALADLEPGRPRNGGAA
jgi:IstB-like ATP binding protein